MIKPEKISTVTNLKNLLSQSKSVAIIDFQGIKVGQATELRKVIRKAGGQYLVAKNTLFKIAAKIKDLDIKGISGFVFSMTDEISAIKAVADFAKKNQIPTFKSGLLGDKILTIAEVTHLATIPDKNTLISKLLGSLKSPQYGLVHSLNWNISKLVRTLNAIKGVTN